MVSANPPYACIGSTSIPHSWVGPNVQRAVLIVGLNVPDIARHELEFSDEVVEGLWEPPLSSCESGIYVRNADDVTVGVTLRL